MRLTLDLFRLSEFGWFAFGSIGVQNSNAVKQRSQEVLIFVSHFLTKKSHRKRVKNLLWSTTFSRNHSKRDLPKTEVVIPQYD
jgi:thiamine monophosphate synthase